MGTRPNDSRGGKGMVVVKPKTQWTRERRFEVLDQVFDSQGSMVRFERCSEVQPNGVKKQFLLKRVKRKGSSADTWDKDLMTWSQLRDCRYIIKYEDAWETTQEVQNVLCEDARMCLSVCLGEMASAGVTPCTQLYPLWLFHIASALEYMHERNNKDHPILHRALQPDNIMVTDSCVLKLCAFGTSKRLDKGRGKTDTVVGGGLFQSPEIRKGQPYDQSADIWSFGVTAVFIADHKRANKTGTFEKLLEIMSESGQNKATQQAVKAALQTQPSERPNASKIVVDLQENYDQDWLRASPSANVFPPPFVAGQRPTSQPKSHSRTDIPRVQSTENVDHTCSRPVLPARSHVSRDDDLSSKTPILHTRTRPKPGLVETTQTGVETAEMTTQTSFKTETETMEPHCAAMQNTGTQTSQKLHQAQNKQKHVHAKVIVLKIDRKNPAHEQTVLGTIDSEHLQNLTDHTEEDLIKHALQDYPDPHHRHRRGSSRRVHPSATTTSSTSSGNSTATTASYSPSTPNTADSQENLKRALEKQNETHSSSSGPLTPHSHRQRPLTSDDDLQAPQRNTPPSHHRSREPPKERHTQAQEHRSEQTTISERHGLPFTRTETVYASRHERAMDQEALQHIAALVNRRPSATQRTVQDEDEKKTAAQRVRRKSRQNDVIPEDLSRHEGARNNSSQDDSGRHTDDTSGQGDSSDR
ncbi:serine/threonine-protein kinase Nek4-like [Littorina saxatilis]|uniref:Protein kinase domain-containing protein n=1 Tax=Littorina saxatilis TaxID=31220 RepID=A0AAN9GB86_9CAEN